MTFPRQGYIDQGYAGVSPLGESCIIAFSVLGTDNPDHMSAAIFSRFDLSLNVVLPDASLDEIASLADSYRSKAECSGTNA